MICNACRYCEGFCPVFRAIETRRDFAQGRRLLSREPLPRLPRLLLRLHVHAAARIRHQYSADSFGSARGKLQAVELAGLLARAFKEPRIAHDSRGLAIAGS